MRTVLGKLDAEDFARFKLFNVQREGVTVNPNAYSRAETEEIMRKELEMYGAIEQKYDLDQQTDWRIDRYNGTLLHDTKDD